MSGSRGEANFVWKCKNCKVRKHSRRDDCNIGVQSAHNRVSTYSESLPQLSRLRLYRIRSRSRRSSISCSSLTAAVWSSRSSNPR